MIDEVDYGVDVGLLLDEAQLKARLVQAHIELHSQVWSQAVAAREKTSSPIFAGHFIQSLNEVVALHARRVTVGLEFRIPNHIWYVLCAITTLAAASIGCHAGLTGASRPLVVTAFVLIISAVMLLIAYIDGSRRVAFRVSQQVLVDLRRAMSEP